MQEEEWVQHSKVSIFVQALLLLGDCTLRNDVETQTVHTTLGQEGRLGDRCSHKDQVIVAVNVLGSGIWLSFWSHFMFVSGSGCTYCCVDLLQELKGLLWKNYALLHFIENSSANILSYYGIQLSKGFVAENR